MSDVEQGGSAVVPPGSRPAVLLADAEDLDVARYRLKRWIKHAIALRRLSELAAAQGDIQLMVLVGDWALIEARKTLELVRRSQNPGGI